MGFIFQDINLLKNLSLIDNVMFPALVSKDADKNAVYQKAKKLMEMTGIEKLADNTYHSRLWWTAAESRHLQSIDK